MCGWVVRVGGSASCKTFHVKWGSAAASLGQSAHKHIEDVHKNAAQYLKLPSFLLMNVNEGRLSHCNQLCYHKVLGWGIERQSWRACKSWKRSFRSHHNPFLPLWWNSFVKKKPLNEWGSHISSFNSYWWKSLQKKKDAGWLWCNTFTAFAKRKNK